jgi:hypothetical protein
VNDATETIATLDASLAPLWRRRARRPDRLWPSEGQRSVRAVTVVEVDNPTPIILSHQKSVIRGTHGSVVWSRCTRCSSSRGIPSVGADSRKRRIVDR